MIFIIFVTFYRLFMIYDDRGLLINTCQLCSMCMFMCSHFCHICILLCGGVQMCKQSVFRDWKLKLLLFLFVGDRENINLLFLSWIENSNLNNPNNPIIKSHLHKTVTLKFQGMQWKSQYIDLWENQSFVKKLIISEDARIRLTGSFGCRAHNVPTYTGLYLFYSPIYLQITLIRWKL